MFIQDYIKEMYPITDRLERLKCNPVERIKMSDDLPYDSVYMVDGQLQKVMMISDERPVPIMELLSWTKGDIDKIRVSDPDYADAWDVYMTLIDVEDLDIANLSTILSDVDQIRKRKEELLAKSCIS